MQVLQTLAGTVGVLRLLYIYYTGCRISKELNLFEAVNWASVTYERGLIFEAVNWNLTYVSFG